MWLLSIGYVLIIVWFSALQRYGVVYASGLLLEVSALYQDKEDDYKASHTENHAFKKSFNAMLSSLSKAIAKHDADRDWDDVVGDKS